MLLAGVAILTIGAAACGTGRGAAGATSTNSSNNNNSSTATPAASTAPDATPVRFIWSPSAFGDWFAADQQGYWQKYGVTVKPIDILNGGVAVMSSLASNSADMALVGDGPVVSAIAKGLKLDIVGLSYTQANSSGLYARPGSGITSDMHSLVGKKIATTKGSGADIAMHKALADAGVSANSVQITYIPPGDAVPVYQHGQVQGEWFWDTPAEQLLAAGAQRVVTEGQLGINANLEVIVVRPAFLSAHPQVVAHALAALLAGGEYANAHASALASYMGPKAGLTTPEATTLLTRDQAPTAAQMLASSGTFSMTDTSKGVPAGLATMAQGLKAEGLITSTPANLDSYIVTAPLQQASALVGG